MSSLEKYIERVKKETEGFNDIEKLRYVYLDLGRKFQFDLNFTFGNLKNKKKIYEHSQSEDDLNKSMDSNTGDSLKLSALILYSKNNYL